MMILENQVNWPMKRSLASLIAPMLLLFAAGVFAAPDAKPAKTANPGKAVQAAPLPLREITLRHGLSGAALDTLATQVLRFNDEEAKLKTGAGRISLEDVKGIADKARLPELALFNQDDALAMFDTRPRFLPLHQVMEAGKQKFEAKNFYPQMIDAIDDISGRIQALPMAMSLPVLFYNKAAFIKAKLNPDVAPKTWWELQATAGALLDAGFKCPLTSSHFAWVHLENVSSQHGEPIITKDGKRDQLALNSMVNVKHIALLTSWHKSSYFIYSGPGSEGDDRFASGECAMLTGESALYARLMKSPQFPLGVAVLPHYDDVYGVRPMQVLPDGAALWVLAASDKVERQMIARFIDFLLKPEIQSEWVRATGFLPMTSAAVKALRESGGDAAVLDRAERRLSMPKRDSARTRNEGFGRSRIRAILNEEIEFVWGNKKPAKEALDTAVLRSGSILAAPPESARPTKR